MKIDHYLSFKEFILNRIKKLTNNHSNLYVSNLGNGYIKCCWEISKIDNFRIDLSKSYFFAIRLFDVTNNRNKINSTCIMKEIQLNKFQSSINFPIPINKGVYHFELGYRKRNGEWRKIAYKNLNLGYRIMKVTRNFEHDEWFDSKTRIVTNNQSDHEIAYQLSLKTSIGGSENIT